MGAERHEMVNRSWVGHAYARVTLSSLRPVARIALEPRLCAKEGRPKYSRRNRAADLSAWPAVSVSAPRGCLGLACNHADDYRISLVMRRVRLVIALSVAGLLMGPAHALGQPQEQPTQGGVVSTTEGPDRERAKQLYEQGLEFYRSRQYSEAIDRLLEADRVMPNAAFSYNIALVYEAMGDQRSALRWLRGYLRQSGENVDQAAVRKARKLEAELQARGLQQVTILSSPPGATLKIDGNGLGITPFTTEITPGSHQASLALEGYEVALKSFELRPDRSMDLEVTLVATAHHSSPVAPVVQTSATQAGIAPVPSPLRATASPTEPEQRAARVRPWTWVSFGVGTALFGGALYYELRREKADSDAHAASQSDYQSLYDRMHTSQSTARILAVVGSVAIATGVILLTVDLTHRGPIKTATVEGCGSHGLCAAMQGRF